MNASDRISTDDLTDEQIEQIINTRLFQKGLAYAKLAEGIEVIREEDEISSLDSIRSTSVSIWSRTDMITRGLYEVQNSGF